MSEELKPLKIDEVEKEAERLRLMLDTGDGNTDMLYAAYNALLLVLGYGVKPPSKAFTDAAATPRINWSKPIETNETPPRSARLVGETKSTLEYFIVEIEGEDHWHPNGEYRVDKETGFIRGKLAIRNCAATPALPETQEYFLRAMATNYAGGHSWDHLDGMTCTMAADEIKALRAALAVAPLHHRI